MASNEIEFLGEQLRAYQENLLTLKAHQPFQGIEAEIKYTKERIAQLESQLARLKAARDPALLNAYLDRVIERCGYIDLWGVVRGRHPVRMRLDEAYFPLHVRSKPEPTPADRRLLEREVEEIMSQADLSPERKESLQEQLRMRYLISPQIRPASRISLDEAVRLHEKLVILGGPGAGKTAFLKYLALHFALLMKESLGEMSSFRALGFHPPKTPLGPPRLPIYIEIPNFAAARQENQNLTLESYLVEGMCTRELGIPGLEELVRHYLREGKCLVLMDGLDGAIDPGERVQIARCVENFVNSHSVQGEGAHQHSEAGEGAGNRFIVSSRLVGYYIAPLTGNFAHYTLDGLEGEEIHAFLERWCLGVERAQSPGIPERVLRERIDWKIEGLTWAMEVNPDLRRLASRPMMLVLLSYIYWRGMRPPQKRIELYELASKAILRYWQLSQDIPSVALVRESEAVQLLGPIACWMRDNVPSGLMRAEEVEEILSQSLSSEAHRGEGAAGLKEWVCRHSGLFREINPGWYGFIHPSFEEYFAARELVAKPNLAVERIRKRLHHPRWNEPILLAIAFIGTDYPAFAGELVASGVLAWGKDDKFTPSPYEDTLHRDLLFAAHCLAEGIEVETTLRQRIVQELLDIYLDHKGKGCYAPLREQIIVALNELFASERAGDVINALLLALEREWPERVLAVRALGGLDAPDVVRGLLAALRDEDWHVRYYAAEALGHLGKAPEVVGSLLVRLKDESGAVRDAAAEALGNLSFATSEVLWGLLAAIEDEDKRARASVVQALTKLGRESPGAVRILLAALRVKNWLVRDSVTRALRDLGHARPEVLPVLMKALQDENWRVRQQALFAISNLDESAPDTIQSLLVALKEDEHEIVRASTAEALGRMGQANPDAVRSLLSALEDESWRVAASAARALGEAGKGFPEVMGYLLAALKDGREQVRSAAAHALGNLGRADEEVLAGLLASLDDEGRYVRYNAVRALGNLGRATPPVVQGLIKALSDGYEVVRESAVEALSRLGKTSPHLIQALLAALNEPSDQTPYLHHCATRSLESLEKVAPPVAKVLLEALAMPDWRVRAAAVRALGHLDHFQPEVAHSLLQTLRDESWRVRAAGAEALGNLRHISFEVVQGLLAALGDENWCVRSAAAHAFGKLKIASPSIVQALLIALEDERQAVRSAAARSLGELGQATPDVVHKLLIALREGNRYLRSIAARALGELGLDTPEVIKGLLAAFKSTDKHVRFSATETLASFPKPTPNVVRALLTALTDRDKAVRSTAAEALGSLGRVTPEIIQALLLTLKDEGRYARYHAAEALGTLGSINGERGPGQAWQKAIAEGLYRALNDPRNEEKVYLKRVGCVHDFVYEALAKVISSLTAGT